MRRGVPGRDPEHKRLVADAKTLKKLREFGRLGLYYTECATRLDVSPAGFRSFRHREPAAQAVIEKGRAERAEMLEKGLPLPATHETRGALKRGDTCPTCGQPVGEFTAPVMLTPASIAEAQRKIDELIDRYDPARRVGEAGGGS